MSSIGYIHKLGSFNDPTQLFLIRKMLAGLWKHNAKPDIRHPITIYMLHKLIDALENVCPSLYNKRMFKAMFLLAFHAFVRIGEIAHNGKEANILKITDLTFFKQGNQNPSRMGIHFHTFKGHCNTSPITLSLKPKVLTLYCPVQTLYNYLQMCGAHTGCIFRFPDGPTVSYSYFCTILKQTLHAAGYSSAHFKSHSFRIGAASTAASQGVAEVDIQAMGRWHANAFKQYI